jgi:predicted GNAT superfamily acetyltransferase
LADRQQAEWTDAARIEVTKYLVAATQDDKTRQIRDLKKHEVEAMAIAVISAYVVVRQRQEHEEQLKHLLDDEMNDSIDDIPLG